MQQHSSPGAATVTTTTLSQLDESAEQIQVATPPTKPQRPGDLFSTHSNLTCVCLQEWFRKFQRFDHECSQYLPFLNSKQAPQNAAPADDIAKATDGLNRQLAQLAQNLKGVVVGIKFISTFKLTLSMFDH